MKKITPIIIFILIFQLIFPKISFGFGGGGGGGGSGQPQCPYYRPVPYDQISYALNVYLSGKDINSISSQVLRDYLQSLGINPLTLSFSWMSINFNEILNRFGTETATHTKIFTGRLVADQPPPNHTRVTRTSKAFYILATDSPQPVDLNGDGQVDYYPKGTLLYLHEINPLIHTLIYNYNPSTTTLKIEGSVLVELVDLAEYVECPPPPVPSPWTPEPGGSSLLPKPKFTFASDHGGRDGDGYSEPPPPNYQLFLVASSTDSDSGLNDYPFINTIFNVANPTCRQWTDKGLFQNTHHLECKTDALAFNGQFADGYAHKEATQKNILGWLLVIFLGVFVAYILPFYLPAAWLTFETFLSLFYFGNFLAIGGTLAAALIQSSFATIDAIARDRNYGTTDNPQGGLEQFSWSCPYTGGSPGFCPPFGGANVSSCGLSATPNAGDPPLEVNFRLSWYNCNPQNIQWDGPCNLTTSSPSCSYTYNDYGVYQYTAQVTCDNGQRPTCRSGQITVSAANFDIRVSSLDIRSFICKNKDFDQSFWNEFSAQNPNYMFAPSTTYAAKFYNDVASSTCPESQRNRPVEFSARADCPRPPCPPYKLTISIASSDPLINESKEFSSDYNYYSPKNVKGVYIFDNDTDYLVKACVVDENGNPIPDFNNDNNCLTKRLRIFDYLCYYGFCAQTQKDPRNPPLNMKILKVFGTTDSPCRYWRNEICRARFGF